MQPNKSKYLDFAKLTPFVFIKAAHFSKQEFEALYVIDNEIPN